ncbi:hypothetical protein CYMTET_48654 [Cymbomonas tetramitiformis]|uniref:Uncharacterized protein n=1 Tax=Cymbomonas tetramitiformis TaxID=36881 RepID=A0AAE0BRX5_9CHLO|nr:hypothetical protein CYMTET_48654 [Cymbomonas tetramitiformis]
MLSEWEALEARTQENNKRAEHLQESIAHTSSELGRIRNALVNIFDTKMELARGLLPLLLRPDLDVSYSWGCGRHPGKLTRWTSSVQQDDEESAQETGVPNSPPYSPDARTSPASSYKAFAR